MRQRIAYAVGILLSAAVAALLLLPAYLHPPARAYVPPTQRPFDLAPVGAPSESSVGTSEAAEAPSATAAPHRGALDKDSPCPSDMVLARGAFCPFVAHKCKERTKDGAACKEFAAEVLCEGTIRDARFCIDELEYPNVRGVKPAVLVTFGEARKACDTEGKRLCTVDEWQFACEGSSILPLASGVRRDGGCNVDAPDPPPLFGALHSPFELAKELMRVDGRVPAGSREACVSPFGARDMSGNVGEWTENPLGSETLPPFRSAIAGGNFGRGEASCRTLDASSPDGSRSHRTGFRCCADAGPRVHGDVPVPSHRSPGGFRPIELGRPGLP